MWNFQDNTPEIQDMPPAGDGPSTGAAGAQAHRDIQKFLDLSNENLFESGLLIPEHVRTSRKYFARLLEYYLQLPEEQFLAHVPGMSRRMKDKDEIKTKLTSCVETFLYNQVPMSSSQVRSFCCFVFRCTLMSKLENSNYHHSRKY